MTRKTRMQKDPLNISEANNSDDNANDQDDDSDDDNNDSNNKKEKKKKNNIKNIRGKDRHFLYVLAGLQEAMSSACGRQASHCSATTLAKQSASQIHHMI